MPDAIITSTASTFGTISGTFAADQSTIVGTVAGSVVGTLTGSVGVPGPQGPAGPGSTWGGIVGTLSDQTDLQSALDAKQNVSGMSAYLTKAGNLSGLTDLATSRDNLGLGSLSTPTFAGVNVPGSGTSVANLGATFLTINQQGSGQFTIQPSQGIVFPDATVQTTAFTGAASTAWGSITGTLSSQTDLQTALNLKAPLASPALSGVPTAPTAATLTSTTQLATTAFVQQELLSGTANARNLEVYVRNQTGSTIPVGSIVYINGATGNRPTITLAQANNDANSAQTFGFTKASIANNGFGFVIVRGELENINTSALTEGVQLYLSPTTAGTWTTTKPSAPQHLVYVGIVVRAHPTQGVILVAVQNGYELEEIHDVQIVSKANNDLLAYESSTNLWKNKSFGTLGLLTSSSLTGYATESWVTSQGYLTDAPSDGNQYARQSGAWSVVSSTSPYITSVSSPLSVTSGDLSIDLSSYLTSATAASTYYPLTGNPSGFITSAALSTYAPLASPALTGNVSIVSNSTGAALFIEQSGSGNILTLHDQAADTNFVAIDANGKVSTIPSVAGGAGFNIAHGTAPTTPVNGDVWTTTSGLFMRQNGSTQQYVDFGGTQTISGAKTFSNANQTLGNSTAAGTINVGTGATISGATKTINIGTGGVSGSTTSINFGAIAGTGTSTTNFNGTVNLNGVATGVTESANSNNTRLATTAFVVGQAAILAPLVNSSSASVGTSLLYARQDHVHSTDLTRAALASPTFTGTPLSTTAAVDTNTTQIATTAFVVGQAASATPAALSTAAVGTSLRYARADHVHANPLPTGGTTAQVLSKVDGTNYNVQWTTVATGGAVWGGITGTLSSQTDLQSALNAKLDSTTAASTYQTISGMSSYLTTAAAAAGYYPLTGNPSGFLTSAPVTSVAGRTGAITLSNTDISGLGTMATATAADYSTTTVANGLYYPLTSNPAGYLTSAPVTSVAGRTGAVTLSNTDISGLGTMATAAAADYALLAGATFTGKVNTPASTTTTAGLNLPHGTAPTTPVNGDIWTTTGNILWRRNGGTQTIPNQGTSNTFSAGAKQTVSHSSTTAGLNVGPVAGDPSTPANGDVWYNSTTNGFNARVNGASHQLNTVKAWVNFNGTGTVAIRASMNVSSITDNGVGHYTINFTTAMADVNYNASLLGLASVLTVRQVASLPLKFWLPHQVMVGLLPPSLSVVSIFLELRLIASQ